MPFSDPIKDRRIAPSSLAFDARDAGTRSAVTYQSTIGGTETATVIVTDTAALRESSLALAAADRMAEARAKAWVGRWHRTFHWDITADIDITNNTWYPLAFNHEAMRGMGIECPGGGGWIWRVPPDWDGTYLMGMHLRLNVQAAANVVRAEIGFMRNGTLIATIDAVDRGYTGENPIRDIVLRNCIPISVAVRDNITAAVRILGGAGTDTYGYASSVVGCVWGVRTMCHFDHIIDTQDDLDGYAFV